jgi:hypothetical protein
MDFVVNIDGQEQTRIELCQAFELSRELVLVALVLQAFFRQDYEDATRVW